MPRIMSTRSVQGKVFSTVEAAHEHGVGGICYKWNEGSDCQFPQDVEAVLIVMPLQWSEVSDDIAPGEVQEKGIVISWNVGRPGPPKWTLTGTRELPTLSPSLNWVGAWHGFLENGFLRSC